MGDKAAVGEDFGGKVCVLFSLDGDVGVFLVNLDEARLVYDAAAEKSKYGVYEGKLLEIEPNFRIPLQVEAMPFFFHVLRDRLYAFTYPISRKIAGDSDLDLQVYAINLSSIDGADAELKLTRCEKCPPCMAPKSRPTALRYHGNLLLFSTKINFRFMDLISEGTDNGLNDDRLGDFEIYDPRACESRILPQLHVCRPKCNECGYDASLSLKLYNSLKSDYTEDEFDDRSGLDFAPFFYIDSYCIDGDIFVVETNFGSKFCLKLKDDGCDDGWRLCEEGYEFESYGLNIVTWNGVCFDAFGANDHRRRWLRSIERRDEKRRKVYHGGEDGIHVDFPSLIPQWGRGLASSAVCLVKDNPRTPCIVQASFNDTRAFVDCPSKLYWFLDVLNLNLEEELDDDQGKFAKQMMTFQFRVPRELTMGQVSGLFYYEVAHNS